MIELVTANDRKRLSLYLAAWAALSMILALVGFIVQPSVERGSARWFVQAISAECLFWGLLEVGFALAGLRTAEAIARGRLTQASIDKSSRTLSRLLAFVVRLNWAFVALALVLIALGVARQSSLLAGHGAGILLQSAFLLLLDRQFLRRVARADSIEPAATGR